VRAVPAAPLPLPDPPLAGHRFVLRPWRPDDAGALAAAWADPELARWTGVPAAHDEAAARRWIEGEAHRRQRGLTLDLVIDVDGMVAGEVGLQAPDPATRSAEVGWWVARERRRRGLATAAVRALAGWAVEELDVEVVVARCDPDNPGSGGVARSAGFTPRADPGGAGATDGRSVVWCYRPVEGGTVTT
jgi:RimJ/RimL family protein N-acetyltransferase